MPSEKKPVCDTCGGIHKTLHHAEHEIQRQDSESEKKKIIVKEETVNPICDICGMAHKTSLHKSIEEIRDTNKK